jgi:predicted transcriptional regulator
LRRALDHRKRRPVTAFENPFRPNYPEALATFPARAMRRAFMLLLQGMVRRTLKAMEVHFSPEQEARLARIATKAGASAERLVKDAALRLLQEDARFRAAVLEGIAQADRGEFIEEEEMDARLERMLRS